jgi:hypothetical protein
MEAVREWFRSLFSYLPGIQFTVHRVLVQGWPWSTLVATHLSVAAPRSDGSGDSLSCLCPLYDGFLFFGDRMKGPLPSMLEGF